MQVHSKQELLEELTNDSDPSTLFAVGLLLVVISVSKRGSTMQESLDYYRKLTRDPTCGEAAIRRDWDALRSWS